MMISKYLKIIKGREIKDKELMKGIEIDKIVYPDEYQGTFEVCKAWQDKNLEIYIFLKDIRIDEVIGCINLMPLSDEFYNLFISGKYMDLEIPVSEIKTYSKPGLYKMCLISITLLKEYRDSEAIKILYNAILYKLIELSKQGIYCHELLADVISADGEKFCKSFGMKKVVESSHKSTLYKVDFFPFNFKIRDEIGENLKVIYKNYTNV
ncbi:MAG: hypothetical protein ABF289_03725 [Clostridiales bacterium]